MTVAAESVALGRVLIVGAALATASPAAWAGDAPVTPFPGAAPGTAPSTGAGVESEAAASGSRLLRALAESSEPRAAPAGEEAAPVFAAEGCPRALLRRLLAGAVDEADALTALAIEREALTLCRERQEIVAGLFETEARLRELRAPIGAAAPAAAVAETRVPETLAPETLVPAPAAAGPAEAAPVSPLRGALAGAAGAASEEEPAPPSYSWFSIIGTAGALRAGITDGEGVWFVRVGDPLPDGGTVVAIVGRPPGVRLILPGGGAEETLVPQTLGPQTLVPETLVPVTPLPFKARPGGDP